MSDNQITVYGNVGTEVDCRTTSNGFCWAMFRVGSTPQGFDRQRGRHDLETVWFTVKVVHQLARNVEASLKVGDPVVVVGHIRTHAWEDEKTKETVRRNILEANAVCHDLKRGTTQCVRSTPDSGRAAPDTDSIRDFEQRNEVTRLTA